MTLALSPSHLPNHNLSGVVSASCVPTCESRGLPGSLSAFIAVTVTSEFLIERLISEEWLDESWPHLHIRALDLCKYLYNIAAYCARCLYTYRSARLTWSFSGPRTLPLQVERSAGSAVQICFDVKFELFLIGKQRVPAERKTRQVKWGV